METRVYLAGNSSAVYSRSNLPEDKEKQTRLLTKLHFLQQRELTSRFRIVAELADGNLALVCLGYTQSEALATARRLQAMLPLNVYKLHLQRWLSGVVGGRWQTQRKLSLPRPGHRRQRRRVG